jgi:hypothetical protein
MSKPRLISNSVYALALVGRDIWYADYLAPCSTLDIMLSAFSTPSSDRVFSLMTEALCRADESLVPSLIALARFSTVNLMNGMGSGPTPNCAPRQDPQVMVNKGFKKNAIFTSFQQIFLFAIS